MSEIQLVSRPNRSFLGFTIAAVISFALHVAGAATEATEAASELQGRWSGTIQIAGQELDLVVDLAREADSSGSASLPRLNVKGTPLADIKIEGAELYVCIQAMKG